MCGERSSPDTGSWQNLRMAGNLVAVLHSPPSGAGTRTLQRVEIARAQLGCRSFSIANLYPETLRDVTQLNGRLNVSTWMMGRVHLERELSRSDTTDVLLGYGVQAPTGASREAYHAQLDWLADQLASRSARIWVFGDRPHHPSRWQRVTHAVAPGAAVESLARQLLTRYTLLSRRDSQALP